MRNPFAQAPKLMQMTVEATPSLLDIIELAVEDLALSSTRYVDPVVPHLTLVIDAGRQDELNARIHAVPPADTPRQIRVMVLEEIDWVEKVQKDFPSFRLAGFFVHGSHAKGARPLNHHPLLIDAASAFGTGEHATTAGCLIALAHLKQSAPRMRRIADIGCGTAILAIGAARLWKSARILASDNDAKAVEVSRHNVRVNRVAARTRVLLSDGYRARAVKQSRYDVLVANILARPLMCMARDAKRQLKPRGTLILSGLLKEQENMVLSAHRAQGLHLKKRLRRGQWSVLVLEG